MTYTKGLYPKYRVERTDGKPVGWCFVLQDTDPLAIPALEAYVDAALDAGMQRLAEDLTDKINHIQQMQAAFDGHDEEPQP